MKLKKKSQVTYFLQVDVVENTPQGFKKCFYLIKSKIRIYFRQAICSSQMLLKKGAYLFNKVRGSTSWKIYAVRDQKYYHKNFLQPYFKVSELCIYFPHIQAHYQWSFLIPYSTHTRQSICENVNKYFYAYFAYIFSLLYFYLLMNCNITFFRSFDYVKFFSVFTDPSLHLMLATEWPSYITYSRWLAKSYYRHT